ncbi:MAG TPA: hypothetical protein P5235_11800 [Saprospiraceae bacterium]|nr:hypothetical protein [Saprospiraceae bacterium]
MKYLIVLTWFFATISFMSCTDRIFINKPKKDIEKVFNYKENDSVLTKIIDNKDTLAYLISFENGPFELYFLFDSLSLCEKEVLKIYCSHCAEEYLKLIKEDKKYKFKKLNNVYYFSKYNKYTMMRVSENEDLEICKKIILERKHWDKPYYENMEARAREYEKGL